MACKSCGPKTNGVCKVCALLDNDLKTKKVSFCNFCNVMICESCEGDIGRRFKAFKKAKVGALKENWRELQELFKHGKKI